MSFHSYPGAKVHNNRKVKQCMLLVIHSQQRSNFDAEELMIRLMSTDKTT